MIESTTTRTYTPSLMTPTLKGKRKRESLALSLRTPPPFSPSLPRHRGTTTNSRRRAQSRISPGDRYIPNRRDLGSFQPKCNHTSTNEETREDQLILSEHQQQYRKQLRKTLFRENESPSSTLSFKSSSSSSQLTSSPRFRIRSCWMC